jgi:uncharacterized LabA/DUF88 family protein
MRPLLFFLLMKRINIYIDGFNLFYGSLKKSQYKWLDIWRLSEFYIPRDTQINGIKYFTANVSARLDDAMKPIRQQVYLRALQTLPNIQIIQGSFLNSMPFMPIVRSNPPQKVKVSVFGLPVRLPLYDDKKPQFLKVYKSEEKGSDVNLASHLLWDGQRGEYDVAIVISNDSDLVEPIRIVRSEMGLDVGILNPYKHNNPQLQAEASFVKQIRSGALAASQFAPVLIDSQGVFFKPGDW